MRKVKGELFITRDITSVVSARYWIGDYFSLKNNFFFLCLYKHKNHVNFTLVQVLFFLSIKSAFIKLLMRKRKIPEQNTSLKALIPNINQYLLSR